jgi:hypothetical protein
VRYDVANLPPLLPRICIAIAAKLNRMLELANIKSDQRVSS